MSELRVYHIQNPPAEPVWYNVAGPAAGYIKIEILVQADLRDPDIWGNVFGLCVLEDGEWVEWYDGEGNTLDEWAVKEGLSNE